MCISLRENRFRLLFFILFYIPFIPFVAKSQCCSTGSPVGAAVNVGVLSRNTLRVNLYYRHSYSDTYYQDDHKTTELTSLKKAYYDFTGLILGYGITKRLTAELDFGYFFDKTQVLKYEDYKTTGYGLSNGGVTFKYGAFIKPAKQIEVTVGAGLRYPFRTEPQMHNGIQLNRDIQSSTNAFGVYGLLFLNKGFPEITLRIFSINRYDYNFADKKDYTYGDILMNSLFVSKKLFKNTFAILQLRGEWKDYDYENNKVSVNTKNTGYYLVSVTPTLSYSLAGRWNISALCDIPVYKKYNGRQLTPKYAYAISLSHDFNLGRKAKVEIAK